MKYRIYKTRDGLYFIKKKGWIFWHSIFSGDFIKFFPHPEKSRGRDRVSIKTLQYIGERN